MSVKVSPERDSSTSPASGMVDSVLKGRDGILKYCNSGEQHLSLDSNSSKDNTLPRYTESTVRKIVKIFSVEEASMAEDGSNA